MAPPQDSPDDRGYSALKTCFAPAGRDTREQLERKTALVRGDKLLVEVLDAMPDMVMVLNGNRQIVAANRAFLATLRATVGEVVEKRPGEAIGCVHSGEGPDGCGTGPCCATCGAVHAVLDSQHSGGTAIRECRILVAVPGGVDTLELRVAASPLSIGGERFIVVVAEDISQARRLAVLQRTFFHDVLNTAGCVQGYLRYLAAAGESAGDIVERLGDLAEQLVEEIQSQRDLVYAEAGELDVDPEPIETREFLEELRSRWARHAVAEGRTVELGEAWDGTIHSDRRLLGRILGNMLKNALEATAPGHTVTLGCLDAGERVVLSVHNDEVMPEAVQHQVFQRSFTTKAERGRGVGTHGMKLLGERYLGGKVDFSSRQPEGTTFRLTLPKHRAGDPW
jgi:nitrogen fixation/metabolism regulation signal transduction histidine kinase